MSVGNCSLLYIAFSVWRLMHPKYKDASKKFYYFTLVVQLFWIRYLNASRYYVITFFTYQRMYSKICHIGAFSIKSMQLTLCNIVDIHFFCFTSRGRLFLPFVLRYIMRYNYLIFSTITLIVCWHLRGIDSCLNLVIETGNTILWFQIASNHLVTSQNSYLYDLRQCLSQPASNP